ncbi:FliG C-terminal domain-containing protein [Aureimonas populi]|uniref:Flagellar motor switch protein FliG n=1 Tax=Aureimonas populi TaxID=1701758 RepID=A0ABW5CHF0_9HYPH|nr:FliG C-terminal domain-containing protein [Aureimonas populi]
MEFGTYNQFGAPARIVGPARAAVLLLAMGPSGASRLIKHLSPAEIRMLRRSAAGQSPVSAEELDELVGEFQEAFKTGPGLIGLDGQMEKLLLESLSKEELSAVLEDGGGMPAAEFEMPLFEQLEAMGIAALCDILKREHPQLVAIILTRLTPEAAAGVVAVFEAPLRNEILRRMLLVKPLSPAAQALMETSLRQAYIADTDRAGRDERHRNLAEIVNRMEKAQAEELLATIAERQPEEAAAIRRLIFSFDDLPSLTKKARLVLFDDVSSDTVITALTGAGDELKETVLSSLAARARRMVEAELSQPRALDPKDVAAARRSIASLALRLANEGRIALVGEEEA